MNPLLHFVRIVPDKYSMKRSVDDDHKAVEGDDGECTVCGRAIASGRVCTKCHDEYRAERLSKRYK